MTVAAPRWATLDIDELRDALVDGGCAGSQANLLAFLAPARPALWPHAARYLPAEFTRPVYVDA